MKIRLKENRGLSGVDIVISIGIIIIFVAIITAAYTNLSLSNIRIERMQKATNCAIAILEKLDKLYFSEIETNKTVITKIEENRQIFEVDIPKGYEVALSIEDSEQSNAIKIIDIEIKYDVGNKEEKIKMQKIKQKEVLKIPNKPILEDGMTPLKYSEVARNEEVTNENQSVSYKTVYEKKLVETNEKDIQWYDYTSKNWALAKDSNEDVYAWIPKFAYHDTESGIRDVKFIYVNGNRFVNSSGELDNLVESYQIPDEFEEKTGKWVLLTTITTNKGNTDIGSILNTSTKYGPMSN